MSSSKANRQKEVFPKQINNLGISPYSHLWLFSAQWNFLLKIVLFLHSEKLEDHSPQLRDFQFDFEMEVEDST